MKKLVIVGAGGFGREIRTLVEHINQQEREWEIIGFLDDGIAEGTFIDNFPVLGGLNFFEGTDFELAMVLAVGDSRQRKDFYERLIKRPNLSFPNLVHPSVIMGDSKSITLGQGVIICANSILTIDVEIGDFTLINLASTIGHNCQLERFVSLMPGVNLSGNVHLEDCVFVGAGANIINGVMVGEYSVIGAGALVNKDLPDRCKAFGVPAKIV